MSLITVIAAHKLQQIKETFASRLINDDDRHERFPLGGANGIKSLPHGLLSLGLRPHRLGAGLVPGGVLVGEAR